MNLLTQPLIALHTLNLKASKDVEFQSLYTKNFEKLDVIEDILVNKSEGAKAEVELLKEVSEVLASIRLRIDFEKLNSIEMTGKYSRIKEIENELSYSKEDIEEAYKEVTSLKEEGLLFTEDIYEDYLLRPWHK